MEEDLENNKEKVQPSTEVITEQAGNGSKKGFRLFLKVILVTVTIIAVLVFLFSVPVYIAPALQTTWGLNRSICPPDSSLLKNKTLKKQIAKLDSDIQKLDRKLSGMIPTQSYIVINTVDNKFFLYEYGKIKRTGRTSTGKNSILITNDGKKKYLFKTPRGRLEVLSKQTNPVWSKPDWAFIEEGLPIPKAGDPSRFDKYTLGDYCLRLRDGYMIHGTIYKRLLGMPVTHGCIRLNDEDLEVVYKTLNPGSKVYIY